MGITGPKMWGEVEVETTTKYEYYALLLLALPSPSSTKVFHELTYPAQRPPFPPPPPKKRKPLLSLNAPRHNRYHLWGKAALPKRVPSALTLHRNPPTDHKWNTERNSCPRAICKWGLIRITVVDDIPELPVKARHASGQVSQFTFNEGQICCKHTHLHLAAATYPLTDRTLKWSAEGNGM